MIPSEIYGLVGIKKISIQQNLAISFLHNNGSIFNCGNYFESGWRIYGSSSIPVLNPVLYDIILIVTSDTHSHFINKNGDLIVFGSNNNGELGNFFIKKGIVY